MNTIPAALRRSLILKSAMEAFKHKLISLGLFSTVLRNVPLEGNNEVDIPYIPLATSASKDFDGTYKFDKGDMESRKITVNRRKYQSLTYTSEEKARQPYFDPITLGRLKGAKLAEDVLMDILSVITKENFGDAILTRNAADFVVLSGLKHFDKSLQALTFCQFKHQRSAFPDTHLLNRQHLVAHKRHTATTLIFAAFADKDQHLIGLEHLLIAIVSSREHKYIHRGLSITQNYDTEIAALTRDRTHTLDNTCNRLLFPTVSDILKRNGEVACFHAVRIKHIPR